MFIHFPDLISIHILQLAHIRAPRVHLCRRLGRKFVFTGTVWGLGGVDDSMAQTIKIASDVENIGKHVKFQGRGVRGN